VSFFPVFFPDRREISGVLSGLDLWYNPHMHTTLPSIDRILEPLAACFTPDVAQRIVDVRVDDPLTMERLEELRSKANEGTLTEAERDEYEAFVEANDVLMLIKDKARSVLQHG
jgi:hypothetical protein